MTAREPAAPAPGDPATFPALQAEIRELAREHDAVILAHSYERPEIQDVADHVGDSLFLSRTAAAASASTIVFCGVTFMAETARILAPTKRVLLPDLAAGCSLADSITVEQLRSWKAEHRAAVVVAYVNTTAAVKAESDYCCTSSNARAVIDAIPPDRPILFLPDMFLGLWLRRVTGRRLHIWANATSTPASAPPTWRSGIAKSPTPNCSSTPNAAAPVRSSRLLEMRLTSSRPKAWSPTPGSPRPTRSSSRPKPASCTDSN
jgi:quinolinate synthetase A subunit